MKLTLLILALAFGAFALPAADDPPADTTPTAQQIIDKIKADTALKQAETERFKAEQDALAAQRKVELDRITAQTANQTALNAAKAADVAAQSAAKAAENAALKDQRQAEIDKLSAQKSLITAATASIPAGGRGSVTFDNQSVASIENTVKAYQAVDTAATKIAPAIYGGRENGTFVILGASDVTAITGLAVFESQSTAIIKRLKDIIALKDKPGMTLPAKGAEASFAAMEALAFVGPAITALTNLVGLFKVDDKYVVHDESADLPAVYGAVASKMAGHGTIYYPEILPPGLFGNIAPVQTALLNVSEALDTLRNTYLARLVDKSQATKRAADADDEVRIGTAAVKIKAEVAVLVKQRDALGASAAEIKKKEALQAQIDEKQKSIPDGAITDPTALGDREKLSAKLKTFLDVNDKYIAIIEPVLKAGDDYITAMTKSDSATLPPLGNLISAERVRRAYKDNAGAYAVQIGVQRLSGTRKEHTNFFGTSLSFSGGVVVSFRVFEGATAKLVAAGTEAVVLPFQR